jgi:NAD(P)-dependent dehydrogenase (short-subunit alcohol dehydrogenase family)
MILEGKTVVVSGVGPGLGREIAVAAARDGANVVIGARTRKNLEIAAEEIDPSGAKVAFSETDITVPEDCDRLAATAVEKFGGIDALVNCAALDAIFGGIIEGQWDEWRQAIEVNLIGTMRMTSAVVPSMQELGGGSIVFIGSQSMYWSQVPQTAYAASKSAVIGAVAHLSRELGPFKIRVNTVVPTWMWGPPVQGYVSMTAKAQGVDEQVIIDGITAQMPLGEIPSDGDVADAVTFFASDRARMITGQALLVNAGEYLR